MLVHGFSPKVILGKFVKPIKVQEAARLIYISVAQIRLSIRKFEEQDGNKEERQGQNWGAS